MINYYELVVNNPTYFKQFSCKDLLFLNYDCPVEVKKMSKWSEHNYIYYVLSGKKTLHTMDQSITLKDGSIAFIKKGACIIEQHFEEPFCIVVFIMPDSFIRSFLRDYTPSEQPKPDTSSPIFPIYDNEMIRDFYTSILPYFVLSSQVPEEIVELKFKELLLHLLHNPANDDLRNHLHYINQHPDTPIQHIMETNFAYNLRIEAYAKMTNRSVSSFKRDFQSLFNTTPGRWLTEKKLENARKLLLQTDKSISDIAFESGFENTAHFSRLFKQKSGTSPLDYRRRAGEKRLQAV